MMKHYTDQNAKVTDRWVEAGWEWGQPISVETFREAQSGTWDVLLTPQKFVPREWFAPFLQNGKLTGTKLLGLAAGGGQQIPIFTALGADCTVLDYSDRQRRHRRICAKLPANPSSQRVKIPPVGARIARPQSQVRTTFF